MTTLTTNLRVLAVAGRTARADLAAIYTWRTWLGGWLVRLLFQVTFFALLGRLLDSAELTRYLAVGNSVAITVLVAMQVVASSAWERNTGTLPLLVAAPGPMPLVFLGRSVQWMLDGTACAVIAFFLVGSLFQVPMPFPAVLAVLPLMALVSASSYALGLLVAALVLRRVAVRNVASNVTYLLLTAVTGVQVPSDFWPRWVTAVAWVLPVTHGLHAIRGVVQGAPWRTVLLDAAGEILVGAGWLLVAMLSFRRLAQAGRRDGSIDFS